MSKNLLIVCTAKKPMLVDSPCCAKRGSLELIKVLNEKIEAAGLTDRFEVKAGGCMKNCHQGISVKVHPEQIIYSNITIEDLDSIINQHLIQGKPIPHLRAEKINRFLEF